MAEIHRKEEENAFFDDSLGRKLLSWDDINQKIKHVTLADGHRHI
jgi:hypothetical protein